MRPLGGYDGANWRRPPFARSAVLLLLLAESENGGHSGDSHRWRSLLQSASFLSQLHHSARRLGRFIRRYLFCLHSAPKGRSHCDGSARYLVHQPTKKLWAWRVDRIGERNVTHRLTPGQIVVCLACAKTYLILVLAEWGPLISSR